MSNHIDGDQSRRVIALMLCLFLGFMYIETVWKPYFEGAGNAPQQTPAQTVSTLAPSPSPQAEVYSDTPENLAQGAHKSNAAAAHRSPADEQITDAGSFAVQTAQITARISLLGGRITELLLNEYQAERGTGQKLNLVRHVDFAPYPLGVYSGEVDDGKTHYRLSRAPAALKRESADQLFELTQGGAESAVFELEGALPDGRLVKKTLTFYPGGYFADVAVSVGAPAPDRLRLALEWTRLLGKEEASMLDPYNAQGYVWYDGHRAQREIFSKLEADTQDFGRIRWVSMDDKYFMVSMLSHEQLVPAQGIRSGQLYRVRTMGEDDHLALSIFFGPKSYEMLEKLGHNLQLNVNLGKTGFISAPLLWLLHFFYRFFGNYGVAIVCLTILVRIVLYPLNASSFRQMKAMQDLKPEMDRIREQVTDKQQQQLEMMALYKKRGVNPMGGCFPVLIQLPIFIGLYAALMLAVELRHASYALWIDDLSGPEKLMIGGFGIPVMVILFVATMLVQQWTTPSAMDPTQKKVMLIMPVVFGFMFASLPAGLTLYYLSGNIIAIAQQKAMTHYHGKTKSGIGVTAAVCALVFLVTYVIARLG